MIKRNKNLSTEKYAQLEDVENILESFFKKIS